jgi:PTH1 family peptidyl-tRNA hydrolase
MKLIVGLGNPGRKYVGTRHNVGFDVVAELARRGSASSPRRAFDAELTESVIGGERVILAAPQTFMNLSGRSVRQILDFYKLSLTDLLVVCDDLNLPLGRLRLRRNGSAGGQKGLKHIIEHTGSEDFARLRIGIDRPPDRIDATAYVLQRFATGERDVMRTAVAAAADAAELWVTQGPDDAMNRVNAAPEPA